MAPVVLCAVRWNHRAVDDWVHGAMDSAAAITQGVCCSGVSHPCQLGVFAAIPDRWCIAGSHTRHQIRTWATPTPNPAGNAQSGDALAAYGRAPYRPGYAQEYRPGLAVPRRKRPPRHGGQPIRRNPDCRLRIVRGLIMPGIRKTPARRQVQNSWVPADRRFVKF